VLIGPGPMQTEMGVIEVVVVVKREEGNDGEKVGVRVGEHLCSLHVGHVLCQVDDLLGEVSYICH